jgi:neutral ceramidase
MTYRIVMMCVAAAAMQLDMHPAMAQQFRAGAATSNITPDIGSSIVGGFAPFPSKHVHDELHARCLVLDDGRVTLALVVCDLLGVDHRISQEARKLIQQHADITPDRVFISGTHTHSAASAMGQDRFKFDQPLDDYQHFIARRIADGVQRAKNNLRPAELGFGNAEAPEHVFNRRWLMRPGTVPENPFGGEDLVKMNPPAGSPNLVKPAGPTDPTISFIAVRDKEGKPLAVFTAYSLHYVGGVGPAHISADYFGMYCEELKRLLNADHQDPPFVALMANGTSGDINNINFREPRPSRKPYEQMRFVAHDVAQKVHAAMKDVQYRDQVTLDSRYREAEIGWRKPTAEQKEWATKTIAKGKPPEGKTDLSYIYAERAMRMAEYPDVMSLPLQVLRIGDVCIGTMPNEIFCEIGLEFKSRSPIQPAFMVSLNHGYFGYLPTPQQHQLGGYETWLGTNRLEPNASVKMLDNLIEMAKEMKP